MQAIITFALLVRCSGAKSPKYTKWLQCGNQKSLSEAQTFLHTAPLTEDRQGEGRSPTVIGAVATHYDREAGVYLLHDGSRHAGGIGAAVGVVPDVWYESLQAVNIAMT